jgi:hypothetical protein
MRSPRVSSVHRSSQAAEDATMTAIVTSACHQDAERDHFTRRMPFMLR